MQNFENLLNNNNNCNGGCNNEHKFMLNVNAFYKINFEISALSDNHTDNDNDKHQNSSKDIINV